MIVRIENFSGSLENPKFPKTIKFFKGLSDGQERTPEIVEFLKILEDLEKGIIKKAISKLVKMHQIESGSLTISLANKSGMIDQADSIIRMNEYISLIDELNNNS